VLGAARHGATGAPVARSLFANGFRPAMLSKAVILEIDRLLREGQLSHRKIAQQLGVSRGTISAIVRGRRGLHGKEPVDERRSAKATRCPACGYRVYLPCLICSARKYRDQQQKRSVFEEQRDEAGGACASRQISCHDSNTDGGHDRRPIGIVGKK